MTRPVAFLAPGRQELAATQYLLREHRRGRLLGEILADPYFRNHCSPEQIDRILVDPSVVHAIGEDVIAAVRGARQLS